MCFKTFDGILCLKLATMPEKIIMDQAFRVTKLPKWHLVIAIATCRSVRPSHAGIVSKLRKLAS